jgi:hypothetical protein
MYEIIIHCEHWSTTNCQVTTNHSSLKEKAVEPLLEQNYLLAQNKSPSYYNITQEPGRAVYKLPADIFQLWLQYNL